MEILKLREHSELAAEAAAWFHSKWDIPIEEYTGSIQGCLTSKSVPQWYVAVAVSYTHLTLPTILLV